MEESERITFDVIGLCETKRKDPQSCTCTNGAGVFLGPKKVNSTSGGNGFAPHLMPKIKQADHTDFYDEARETAGRCRSYYKTIAGDFNAFIGSMRPYEGSIGPYSLVEQKEAGERLLRAKCHFNNTKALLEHMTSRRPPPTILDAEAAERLAKMHNFEELDAIYEGFDKLVVAITTISDSCRKKKPNHIGNYGRNTATARKEEES
ncbi:hypothetical protein ANCDUO_10026 [Ancylostoma duodenale]|uniref:Uncharacterized protein n=1 Tax=Ancylostoma duodenale TaxID=51022 RepID=A0A0C2DBD1_9BILA|nr:hypothetical protein ANCDUO_10026 [Ancylostoma duodenale]